MIIIHKIDKTIIGFQCSRFELQDINCVALYSENGTQLFYGRLKPGTTLNMLLDEQLECGLSPHIPYHFDEVSDRESYTDFIEKYHIGEEIIDGSTTK